MQSDFDIVHILVEMMLAILKAADPEIHELISRLTVPPFFCISWMITWFSHDVATLQNAQAYFDFFISRPPMAIIYASAALPVLVREQLLEMDPEEASLHQWLKELPKRVRPSLVVERTMRLMKDYPFGTLRFSSKKKVSRYAPSAPLRL